jgi:WD40 repeat protein/serine/threonine protein kinase
MKTIYWQRIESLYEAAVALDAAERHRFLQRECSDDDALQTEILSLAAAHDEATGFLEAPVPLMRHSLGASIEQYRVLSVLGVGGMGEVFLAEDTRLHRQVALKLLRPENVRSDVLHRFKHERQILATLKHPHIARLLDGGTTSDGQPYIVMEYVGGMPINEYCQQQRPALHQLLQLFLQVCSAVQYAHQHLIVHRDLKPANILVTSDGTPMLLDFGIAKLLQPDLKRSYQTQAGQTPMTPAYASPEQVRGAELTTTSDVYSLGVILYELLTGCSPYQLPAQTFSEMIRAITDQEPVRPSEAERRRQKDERGNPNAVHPANDKTQALRHASAFSISPTALRGDLDSILLMALRKEPLARFGSVEQLAADINRFLHGLPIQASKGTLTYRVSKFVRRNKIPVVAAALILLSLVTGLGATLRQARIARAEQAKAVAERQRAEAHELANRQLLYASQMRIAQTAWEKANVERVRELLTVHIPQPGQPDLRGFEWNYLWRLSHAELATLPHAAPVHSVAFSPEGNSLISVTESPDKTRVLRMWDTATWREKYQVTGADPSDLGRQIAVARNSPYFMVGGFSQGIDVRETTTGERIKKIAETVFFLTLALSPDGQRVAGGLPDGSVVIYEAHTGRESSHFQVDDRFVLNLAFSPDGQKLATLGRSGSPLKLWDVVTGRELWQRRLKWFENSQPTAGEGSLHFLPDGRSLVCWGDNEFLEVIDANTGKEIRPIRTSSTAYDYALSPDGKIIAVDQDDGYLTLWDTATWKKLASIKAGGAETLELAFAPDGKTLAAANADGIVRLWDVQQSKSIAQHTYLLAKNYVVEMAFAPAAERLLILDSAQSVHAFDTQTKQEVFTMEARAGLFPNHWDALRLKHSFACTTDGSRFAVPYEQNIKLLDTATGNEVLNLPTPSFYAYALNFSSDGRMIAANLWMHRPPGSHTDAEFEKDFNHLIVWETATGRQLLNLAQTEIQLSRAVFLPDHRTLVTGGTTGHLAWWDLATGKLNKVRNTQTDGASLTLSPDGKWLAVADQIGAVWLFDAVTGEPILALKGHQLFVLRMAFSSDSTRLLTGGADETVRLWDLRTGQELLVFEETSQAGSVAFSPDGKRIAMSYPKGVVKELLAAEGVSNIGSSKGQ